MAKSMKGMTKVQDTMIDQATGLPFQVFKDSTGALWTFNPAAKRIRPGVETEQPDAPWEDATDCP